MDTIAETPVQEAVASRGNRKFWLARVLRSTMTDGSNGYYVQTESWQTTKTGESQRIMSTPRRVNGKNRGRANETTDHDQAIFEMSVELHKKQDAGYHDLGTVVERRPLPMLAHKWENRKHDLSWYEGAFIQRKLDGIRALHDGRSMWSRKGKDHLPAIVRRFACDLPPEMSALDGELILPQPHTFQETTSAVKREQPLTEKVEYHVYDFVPSPGNEDTPFARRVDVLTNFFKTEKVPDGMTPVETLRVYDEEQVAAYHVKFVSEGYEGAIVRPALGIYKVGHRSTDLLKVKSFDDGEFVCVGAEEGVGKDEGTIIFVLKTANGQEFRARPEGTVEQRGEMWRNRTSFVGKSITVRFFGTSNEGVPRFPVAVTPRDYEE